MAETWRPLLASLTAEFEQMSSRLRQTQQENAWLRDLCDVQSPSPPKRTSHVAPPPRLVLDSKIFFPGVDSDATAGDDTISTSVSRLSQQAPFEKIEDLHPNYVSETSDTAATVLQKVYQPPSVSPDGAGTKSSRFADVVGDVSAKLASQRIDFMILRAQKTMHFQIEKPWYLINPDNNSLATIWQAVTCMAMAFVALITPVQVGLVAEPRFDVLFVVSLLVDGIFAVDLVMQFFTTYSRRTSRGLVWETKLSSIARQYLRTWFLLDATSLIPFDLINMAIGSDGWVDLKSIKVIRVLRLLKLMRLLKTSQIIHRVQIPTAIPYQHLALARFVLVLMIACHWLACLWAMTLQLVDPQFPRWINDIEASDLEFGIISSRDPFRIYIAAFYFCSYTMTSVGYGDISPKNVLERLVCVGIILSAGLCWAYILGEVCGIVADMTSESQEFRKRMYQLNNMMKNQELPQALRARLRSYFLQNRHQAQFLTQQSMLQAMSPQLQSEVSTVLNLPWIQKVTFFSQFLKFLELQESRGAHVSHYKACISDIAKALKCAAFAQQETFDNVQVLYILSKGLVALDRRVGYNGTVWGEDFVLSDKSLIRPVSGYALTYIEVLFLTRDALMDVIEKRKSSCPHLARIVRQYCVRVAVFRGILAEAKRRRASASLGLPALRKVAQPQRPLQVLHAKTPSFGHMLRLQQQSEANQSEVGCPEKAPSRPRMPHWEEV